MASAWSVITFMLSLRDELDTKWQFPAAPEWSGDQLWSANWRRQAAWITVKGEDSQATEQLAETIFRYLNPAGDAEPGR